MTPRTGRSGPPVHGPSARGDALKPQVRLCSHLSEPAPGEAPFEIEPDEILEACDGPIVAIVRCRSCPACGWIEMLDWSLDHSTRVYGIAGIDAADVAIYTRNRRAGSCDVDRARRERDALAACAGRFTIVFAYVPSRRRVLAAAPYPSSQPPPSGEGTDRLPASTDPTWFDLLGVTKDASKREASSRAGRPCTVHPLDGGTAPGEGPGA